ncbi:nucleoside/nucleotide kinase family protein [Gaopeijia maritima]|uniref:Uncharacterized protein n=1 Tax=Gaopeijia maritima TaxID=3119007 RepID=A0ABU9E9I7_9BACT
MNDALVIDIAGGNGSGSGAAARETVHTTRPARGDVEERGRRVDSVVDQYATPVRPLSKPRADLILPEGGHDIVAIELPSTPMAAIFAAT